MRKVEIKKKTKQTKFTLKEISDVWNKLYGEDMKTEYSGFYNRLKNKKK